MTVDFDKDSIIRYMLYPLEPEQDINKKELQEDEYTKRHKRIKEIIKSDNTNNKLYCSALYNDIEGVGKIEK